MKTAIAIFVKTPSLSPVKTRLAAGIGGDKAAEFYLLSLKAIAKTLSMMEGVISPFWAVGEEEGLDNPLWSEFKAIYTGAGDLGDRQHHIYSTLLKQYDRVLLVGADAPQISQDIINAAVLALDTHDFTIGKAHDGGYYLFGGRKNFSKDIWKSVPWSVYTTCDSLVSSLSSSPYMLPLLTDVDIESDLEKLVLEMPKTLNIEQENMVKWIKANH